MNILNLKSFCSKSNWVKFNNTDLEKLYNWATRTFLDLSRIGLLNLLIRTSSIFIIIWKRSSLRNPNDGHTIWTDYMHWFCYNEPIPVIFFNSKVLCQLHHKIQKNNKWKASINSNHKWLQIHPKLYKSIKLGKLIIAITREV